MLKKVKYPKMIILNPTLIDAEPEKCYQRKKKKRLSKEKYIT